MPDFYSIREAITLTGTSMTTFRRYIRGIVADDQHPDRKHILPTPEEVRRMKAAGEQFPWKISGDLLKREFGEKARPQGRGACGFRPPR
jgi:hypothetical protein